MKPVESNLVYVVALGGGGPTGSSLKWVDVVQKRNRYFHPVGAGYPKEPPNYIAFRYGGRLRSIHHIEDYEVIRNLHSRFPEMADEEWAEHFLYTLGPPFSPQNHVLTGKIYPSGRVWCMLDTLLTSATISEARDVTSQRKSGGMDNIGLAGGTGPDG